jgi:hypothetical protein
MGLPPPSSARRVADPGTNAVRQRPRTVLPSHGEGHAVIEVDLLPICWAVNDGVEDLRCGGIPCEREQFL